LQIHVILDVPPSNLQTKNKAPPKTKSKVFVPDVKIARMIKGGKKPKNKITNNNNNNNNQKKNQREKPPTNSKINNVVVAGGGEGCSPRALWSSSAMLCPYGGCVKKKTWIDAVCCIGVIMIIMIIITVIIIIIN
jgi:hypothetical protein